VTKFELVYSLGGSDIKTVPVQGNRLPASDLTAIKSLKKGSRVWIENIEAVMLDENQRPVSGVTPKKLGNISLKLN
jgi:hypothetical protein